MSDDNYMQEALALAKRGEGYVEPNPMVGAVLVRDECIVARGWHELFGGPHAEINCLRAAKTREIDPADCEMFVTLEPCSHHGKTPPCADAIIDAGLKTVHVAVIDPNENVRGQGIEKLRAAGIDVRLGCLADEARRLIEPFAKRTATGLPWVIAKWAQTLDGRVATRIGHSQWISNAASRKRVHEIRARVDAIATGIGTVQADDPQLTARDVEIKRVAKRVVIDPNLKIDQHSKLIQTAETVPVIIATTAEAIAAKADKANALANREVELFTLTTADDDGPHVLESLLGHLVQNYEATNVLIEGGPTLLGHLLREEMIDQVLAFVAPKLLGDAAARAAIEGFDERTTIDHATRLELVNVERIEGDVMLDYRVARDL